MEEEIIIPAQNIAGEIVDEKIIRRKIVVEDDNYEKEYA